MAVGKDELPWKASSREPSISSSPFCLSRFLYPVHLSATLLIPYPLPSHTLLLYVRSFPSTFSCSFPTLPAVTGILKHQSILVVTFIDEPHKVLLNQQSLLT